VARCVIKQSSSRTFVLELILGLMATDGYQLFLESPLSRTPIAALAEPYNKTISLVA